MVVNLASALYAAIARARRRWYARHPDARRRLRQSVVSVGNLAVGGSGKTPVVAHLAGVLQDLGERPAILTRGYARRLPEDGVTVVHDGRRLLADLDRAGDEPLMLARQLGSVPVLVSADRHLAGVLAERRLGCTVHVLDDGFQHLTLHRDVDLVLVSGEDLDCPKVLPAGRLREPIDALQAASAVVAVDGAQQERIAEAAARAGVGAVFRVRSTLLEARLVEPAGRSVMPSPGRRVVVVAGLARPARFFAAVAEAGWVVAREIAFPDHHRYGAADLTRLAEAMHEARAVMIVTSEKDAVRMLPLRPLPMPVAWVPLQVSVEPSGVFRAWLGERLAAVRGAGGSRG